VDEVVQAVEEVSTAIDSLHAQTRNLAVELARAMGDEAAANAIQRRIDTQGLTDAEIAVYDYNVALRAQIDAINKAAASAKAAADQRYSLETQLLQLQGNTTALRERELALLDPTNTALQEQIWALQDAAAAEEVRKQAMEKAAEAARQLRDQFMGLADTLFEEARRTRGMLVPQSREGLAQLQTQFAMLTAQARAGDQGAAGRLSGVNQSILSLAQDQLSALDFRRLVAQQSFSLDQSGLFLQDKANGDTPVVTEMKEMNMRMERVERALHEGNDRVATLIGHAGTTATASENSARHLKEGIDSGFRALPGSRALVTQTTS